MYRPLYRLRVHEIIARAGARPTGDSGLPTLTAETDEQVQGKEIVTGGPSFLPSRTPTTRRSRTGPRGHPRLRCQGQAPAREPGIHDQFECLYFLAQPPIQ